MKKIEQEKNRPASNIPYQGVNKPFRTMFIVPGPGVTIERDANGVCYISAEGGAGVADLVAGDNIALTKTDDGKIVISAVDTATDISAGQNITIDIDPETGTAVINSITGGETNEHYQGVFDTAEDLIAFDTDPEIGDYGMIKQITYSDGGETTWNGQYKYCFFINGQWTVVDQMLTFTDDIDLLHQFYSVGGSSPVIYLHKIAQTGSFRDLRDVPIVATPNLTVEGTTLTATCDTEGAEIWYTTDGSMPHVNGNKYTGPIKVSGATTFRFVGIKNGMINSLEATIGVDYQLQPPTIDLDWHDGTVTMANPNKSGTIYYTTDGSTPTNASNVYTGPFVITESTNFRLVVIEGANQSSITNKAYQRVPTAGIGSGLNTANGISTCTLTSESGSEIHYTIDGSTPTYQSELYSAAFQVHYYDYVLVSTRVFKEGYVPSVVHASHIGKSKPVDPPYRFDPETNTVTLVDSENYNSSGNAVSGKIAGVPGYVTYNPANIQPLLYHRIWYTLDGSTPSLSNGTMYNGPIHIDGHSVALKAVLVGYGQYYSDVITESIEVISEPEISLDSDTGFISISGPSESTIYYTIDGSMPTTESTEYSAPFDVTNRESVTVKAICVKDGFESAVAEVTYPGLLTKWSGTSGGETDYRVGTISRTPRRAMDGASVFYAVRAGGGYPSLADWIPYSGTEIRIPLFDENNPKEFFFRQTKQGYIPGYYGGTRVGYTTPDAPVIDYDEGTGMATFSLDGNTSEIPLQRNNNVPQIGARIYYTLDGSAPTDQSTLWNGNAVQCQAGDLIKAICVCYGRYSSAIAVHNVYVPESALNDDDVSNIVKNLTTGEILYVPQASFVRSALGSNYVEKDWMRQERNRDGIVVLQRKIGVGSAKFATDNLYKIYCDTTANGGFTLTIGRWGATTTQVVEWAAGESLDSIVLQLTNHQDAIFAHVVGEDFIRLTTHQSSSSYDCTLTNNTGGTVVDLSKQCRIGGVVQAESHRVWQGTDLHILFPGAGIPAANTVQYAKSGLNLSYRCGCNIDRFMYYYEVSGSGHGGVDTYLAEDSVSARMSRVGFASCNGSSNPYAQALYDKYSGSWEAYMMASMVNGESTNANGVVDHTYSVADTVSSFLASVETVNFAGEWIPAFPIFYNAYQVVDDDFGHGIVGSNHDMSVYMDANVMAKLNAGGCNISRSGYYWSVAQYIANNGWFDNGVNGTVGSSNKCNDYIGARVLAYIRPS